MGAARNGECSAVVVVAGIRWALRSIVHAVVAAAAIRLEFCKLGLEALQALGVGRVVATKRGLWTALRGSKSAVSSRRRDEGGRSCEERRLSRAPERGRL